MSGMRNHTRRLIGGLSAVALLAGLATVASTTGVAPTASAASSELFISEYIEGSSNNKAIEIFNGTGAPIDLAAGGYSLQYFYNGNSSVGLTIGLSGTVADGDVFVVAQSSADPLILAQADITSGAGFFNGDDAVALVTGTAIVDVIGQIGVDPGSEWGSALTSTQDNTLQRTPSVCAGDTDGSDAFDPSIEWNGFAQNTFDGLGAHSADCGDGGGGSGPVPGDLVINEIMQNPSAVSDADGEWFEIANVSGDPIDLDGWTISDLGSNTHTIGGTVVVPAGGFVVLGNNADSGTNGGVAVDYEYSSFTLGNSDDEVILTDPATVEYDRVEYDGGPTFPDPTGASMALLQTLTDTVSNNDGANWCTATTALPGGDAGTPGAVNDCDDGTGGPEFGVCGDLATFIHEVQGNGFVSPIEGSDVVIEGVVVGDFQGSAELRGFFVQEEDDEVDGDPATSEGVFVFDNAFGLDVNVGDVVRVGGTVDEFFGLTQITDVSNVAACSNGASVTSAGITLPVLNATETWEQSEGMSVNFTQTLFASGNFTLARFGEVDLSVGAPLDNPTNIAAPGADALAVSELNNRSRIQLDDGSNVQNPVPIPPYFAPDGTLRTGDSVDDLDAVLSYGFGSYELHPTEDVSFTRVNERPTDVPAVGGSMTVAAYNVLNYFTTLDGNGPICGPDSNQNCRGADTADELQRQQDKLAEAISALDADVVGIIEVENAPDDTPIATLVDAVNAEAGAGTYAYLATGPVGTDAIRVAFIYKPSAVEAVGDFAVLDSTFDPAFIDTKNRAALAQTFRQLGTDDLVTVAVNHLKSKGSACDDVGDPNGADGQGNCNGTRTAAAGVLTDWLSTDPTATASTDTIIVGDLNAYAQEDPITTIEAAGYTDLIETYVGTGFADGAYSFNFFAESGYLDHGLANASLLDRVTGAGIWHVNSDEPSGLDYNNFNQAELFQPDRYRSSDHDPVVVGICEATPPLVSVTADRDVLTPPNHKYVDVATTVEVTDADPDATVTLVDVTSNEPDNGKGDGNTVDDIVVVDDTHFQLRAERSGRGDGRVYTITYDVTDACGNTTVATATVVVPK